MFSVQSFRGIAHETTDSLMQAAQNQIRTTPRPNCFLCGAEGSYLYRGLMDSYSDAPEKWDFKHCPRGCGLLWLDPRPIEQDLHLAYQQYFTHGDRDGKSTAAGKLRTLLYQGYRAVSVIPQLVTGLRKSIIQMEQMFLDDLPRGKLLDVGCGDGLFLNRMRKLGWTVDGLDVDAKAIENAKNKYGLTLHRGDLRSARFPENSFDAVTLSHVIEHVPDPVALLLEARRIAKPGAHLVLTTPNNASLGHQKFQAAWLGLDPPRHLQVFSLRALEQLALRADLYLKVVSVSSTAANADIFIGGSLSIGSASNRRTHFQPPPNLPRLLKAVWDQYREHFALASQPDAGEEAVLICAKPRD
jgi:2-polyprenyl-3-methyl-5-hydroxy-6-metoxy-1,4-benzoquinol methylase